MIKNAYYRGFAQKCAQYGVNPSNLPPELINRYTRITPSIYDNRRMITDAEKQKINDRQMFIRGNDADDIKRQREGNMTILPNGLNQRRVQEFGRGNILDSLQKSLNNPKLRLMTTGNGKQKPTTQL